MHRIETIFARCLDLPLHEPFETAQRLATSSQIVVVELYAGGVVGLGEATPVRYVTGEDVNSVIHDIAVAARALEGTRLNEYRLASSKLKKVIPHARCARAGVEMAIMDALCRTLGLPLYAYLGGAPMEIETDATIPILCPDRSRELAADLGARGFRLFKVKVGKDPEEDLERVVAISEGSPCCSFILDANQGFTPTQAVSFVESVLGRGLQVRALEQPVDAADLDGMRFVTETAGVPIFADECAQTPEDVIEIVRYRAAHGVNVKIMKAGIIGALEIKSICTAAGLDLMFGCMLESRIGQSAAAHLGCGLRVFNVFDLDSDMFLAEQPVEGGVRRQGAVLNVLDRPGLGCEILER